MGDAGKPVVVDPTARYQVCLSADEVSWREVAEPSARASTGPFHVQGSFNDWNLWELMPGEIPGLFSCEIGVGTRGRETFQIVADMDLDKVIFPSEENCRDKFETFLGPCPAPSRHHAWVITGEPGTYFDIEFFVTDSCRTVSWIVVDE